MTVIFKDEKSGNVLSVTDDGDSKTIGIDYRHTGVRVSMGARLGQGQIGELITALFSAKDLPTGRLRYEEWQILMNLLRRFEINYTAPDTDEEKTLLGAYRVVHHEHGRVYPQGE